MVNIKPFNCKYGYHAQQAQFNESRYVHIHKINHVSTYLGQIASLCGHVGLHM